MFCSGFTFVDTHREIKTNRPVIGIIAQPGFGPESFYVQATYVKLVESSGARVVPIRADLCKEKIKELFQFINGAIFPGGSSSLISSRYANASRIIFNLARKTFDNGGYFPIMGMCLGHQFLATELIGPYEIRIRTDSINFTAPLNLSKDYRKSRLFRDIPEYLVKSFTTTPEITGHFHKYSLPVQLFEENKNLRDFYRILSTNCDRKGQEFVSTMEGRKYPFYSTQWHPEKCAFLWAPEKNIPHSPEAIQLAQYMSNFIVNEARLSSHKFACEKELRKSLIDNYRSVHYVEHGQIYII